MAEIWGAALIVGGAVYSSRQAGKAADAQGRAGDAAIDEQRRQFDTMLNLSSNQRQIGNQALNALGSIYGYDPAPGYSNEEYPLYGGTRGGMRSQEPMLVGDTELPPGTTFVDKGGGWYEVHYPGFGRIGTLRPGGANGRFLNDAGVDIGGVWQQWEQSQMAENAAARGEAGGAGNQLAPDYSEFYKSPDYQFRRSEGLDMVQNSAAARGGLYSGNALRGITEYGSGLAAGEFGNYVNRQLALAGMGQTATTQAGNAAMTTGANVGNLLVGQGNARASGIVGQANAITGGANDLASLYGMYRGGFFGGGGTGYWNNQAVTAGGG
jgi:hypothetical protein